MAFIPFGMVGSRVPPAALPRQTKWGAGVRVITDGRIRSLWPCEPTSPMLPYSQMRAAAGNQKLPIRKDRSMSNDRKYQILAAGLKAGGKDGFALKQQVGSLANILKVHKVDPAIAESILEEAEESGIFNASQTLQFLKKQGVIAEKVDANVTKAFQDLLK